VVSPVDVYTYVYIYIHMIYDDIKESKNLVIFKKKFKDMTLEKYRCNSIDDAS